MYIPAREDMFLFLTEIPLVKTLLYCLLRAKKPCATKDISNDRQKELSAVDSVFSAVSVVCCILSTQLFCCSLKLEARLTPGPQGFPSSTYDHAAVTINDAEG
jgi:hypothetical protein